jgi:hypothetical protein
VWWCGGGVRVCGGPVQRTGQSLVINMLILGIIPSKRQSRGCEKGEEKGVRSSYNIEKAKEWR